MPSRPHQPPYGPTSTDAPPPSNRMPGRDRLLALGVSSIFFFACALPVLRMSSGGPWPGWQVLALGWLGVFAGQFAWCANLAALGALICLALGWRPGIIGFAVATIVGLHIFMFPGATVPGDEGTMKTATVLGLGPAVWPWLASLAAPAVGAVVLRRPS